MTFNPAAAQCLLEIIPLLPDKELIIEFGSQRYTSQRIFQADNTRDFYLKNGFKEYMSLDVNDAEFNVKCDLNEPVDLGKRASLVTNIGTSEHIFDQGSVFKNMHDLCKPDGIMFFHLPFTPWLNHGFFNYNPILFPALAHANKYYMMSLKIGDREGNVIDIPYHEIVMERGQHLLEKVAKEAPKPLFVYCALRKRNDEPFKKPFQGRYVQDIADGAILQRYT